MINKKILHKDIAKLYKGKTEKNGRYWDYYLAICQERKERKLKKKKLPSYLIVLKVRDLEERKKNISVKYINTVK